MQESEPVLEFDAHAANYAAQHKKNISISGEEPAFFAEYKAAALAKFARDAAIRPRNILDFGTGIGNAIPFLQQYFPEAALIGTDVSQASLDMAATLLRPQDDLVRIAGDIPLPTASNDVGFAACVFHHIPHDEHVHWLAELRRVTRPSGMLSVFEHNPLNPLTLHAVNTCPFDKNARLIQAWQLASRMRTAGWFDVRIRFHIFFPRALASLRRFEGWLQRVPIGAQYSVTGRKS